MQIYLPIAEMPVNILVILLLGGFAGILSGLFGVGGGFLATPLLIFIGVPPAVAVSSSSNQIIAASFSGFLTHNRRKGVDFKMGFLLLVGGFFGSSLGVSLFTLLQKRGQIDLTISLIYVFFLGTIGTLMANESIKAILRKRRNLSAPKKKKENWLTRLNLPLKVHFPASNLEVSALLPITIGIIVGILMSLMGIGGGLIMVPAMIYLLRMPTSVVIGTSLFQVMFTSANVTLLQALNTHTVDIVLALLMLTGSAIGAQFGTRLGTVIPAEYQRAGLSFLILCIVIRLAFGLFVVPPNLFEIITLAQGM